MDPSAAAIVRRRAAQAVNQMTLDLRDRTRTADQLVGSVMLPYAVCPFVINGCMIEMG
jgi:hypothetical protein